MLKPNVVMLVGLAVGLAVSLPLQAAPSAGSASKAEALNSVRLPSELSKKIDAALATKDAAISAQAIAQLIGANPQSVQSIVSYVAARNPALLPSLIQAAQLRAPEQASQVAESAVQSVQNSGGAKSEALVAQILSAAAPAAGKTEAREAREARPALPLALVAAQAAKKSGSEDLSAPNFVRENRNQVVSGN